MFPLWHEKSKGLMLPFLSSLHAGDSPGCMIFGCHYIAFLSTQYLRTALEEYSYISHKCPLGVRDELIGSRLLAKTQEVHYENLVTYLKQLRNIIKCPVTGKKVRKQWSGGSGCWPCDHSVQGIFFCQIKAWNVQNTMQKHRTDCKTWACLSCGYTFISVCTGHVMGQNEKGLSKNAKLESSVKYKMS